MNSNDLQKDFALKNMRQECIPVGCVPSAAVAVSPPRTPPTMHIPLPCMSPCHAHSPCHAQTPHAFPPAMHAPTTHAPAMHAPLPCTPPCHAHPLAMHTPRGQNDRRLWKHNLSATTVADGKTFYVFTQVKQVCSQFSAGCDRKNLVLLLYIRGNTSRTGTLLIYVTWSVCIYLPPVNEGSGK